MFAQCSRQDKCVEDVCTHNFWWRKCVATVTGVTLDGQDIAIFAWVVSPGGSARRCRPTFWWGM